MKGRGTNEHYPKQFRRDSARGRDHSHCPPGWRVYSRELLFRALGSLDIVPFLMLGGAAAALMVAPFQRLPRLVVLAAAAINLAAFVAICNETLHSAEVWEGFGFALGGGWSGLLVILIMALVFGAPAVNASLLAVLALSQWREERAKRTPEELLEAKP